jgi:hypothetical protein
VCTSHAITTFKIMMGPTFALAPALIRSALKVKTAVPQSPMTGMFIIVLPWLYSPMVWVVRSILERSERKEVLVCGRSGQNLGRERSEQEQKGAAAAAAAASHLRQKRAESRAGGGASEASKNRRALLLMLLLLLLLIESRAVGGKPPGPPRANPNPNRSNFDH